MPEICAFYGIVITIYFDDHLPAHFHAEYGGDEVLLNIDTLSVVAGKLSARAMSLVMEWASLHREELKGAWQKTQNLERPGNIDPLA
jgi:uncharacterized protein DUF4160